MERWTLEHNTYLSCLLDDITGTREMVKIRKDHCKIVDCIISTNMLNMHKYFTGSKAEGLDLPGSDEDYMNDYDYICDIEISESSLHLLQSTRKNKFVMVTDEKHPGFAFLKCCFSVEDPFLRQSMCNIGQDIYLGNGALLSQSHINSPFIREVSIQGPSNETWTICDDIEESGMDLVPSIRCQFWPSAAKEWIDRPRHYGWPSLRDREYIVRFGFHLVSVGHHHSPMKEMQWRISFSIAERTLVWSFNHAQMQCYAVMKLILKEFIKVKSENSKDVLCSYFIKTFLLWQYEETDPSFWQIKNLRGCIMYLLREFYKSLQGGVLRHYFIPQFNLLEVKLTGSAKRELLTLFGTVIQYDIAIMEQCPSLISVWTQFQSGKDNIESEISKIDARHIVDNEEVFMAALYRHMAVIDPLIERPFFYRVDNLFYAVLDLLKADLDVYPLASLVLHELLFLATKIQAQCLTQGNISRYHQIKNLRKNMFGIDISSNRLWCALFLHQSKNYSMALQLINKVLSFIPPYALYCSAIRLKTDISSKMLYRDHFYTRGLDEMQRAKNAWLFDMNILKSDYKFMPRAIQIELFNCAAEVTISPFTFAYCLMFLCYHELGQYNSRDWALVNLLYTLKDEERCSSSAHHSYNIAGHCLLLTGQVDTARTLFLKSIENTSKLGKAWDDYNSTYLYLSYM